MRVAYANIDGVRTRYVYAGQGPALLLLHGVGLSADCFLRNFEGLARNFAVYAPDLLGHGFSDAVQYESEAAQVTMARQIAKLADFLKLDRYAIAGSSFGALVAALTYFEQPTRVNALILVGSGSVFHPADEQKRTLRAAAENGSKAMENATLEECRVRVGNIVFDPTCVPPELVWIQLTSYAKADRLSAYMGAISSSIAHADDPGSRVFPRLEDIRCPTLIIVGRDDIRADWRWHERGAARMPNARMVIYEQCGHLPFLEYPDRFDADVSAFLNRETSAQPRGLASTSTR